MIVHMKNIFDENHTLERRINDVIGNQLIFIFKTCIQNIK